MPDQKQFTRAEVAARNSKEDAVFVIHNHVYDVTPFLDEHPGGHEVLLRAAGADASEDFDDIGHSLDAKELMKKYQIGEVVPEEHVEVAKREYQWEDVKHESGDGQWLTWRLPLILGVVASLTWLYFQ
ncbi:hypothetical protein MSG28_010575 [Choristoneura fumiferana]|uniref:Uncharacterized protein n=1 Tax=Choristoneura fumiferana TaxID=7141 RepID=A0ACC0KN65_CHOFU|nr:hypothetical protein MSG28_010575 [Choristoneura fumiferana]